jgi:dipeptidyl aminopeptidase/acylaminoacyl peptidase
MVKAGITARLCGAFVLCHSFAAVAALPSVDAFAQRPALIDVDLNPAGTRLAWLEDTGKGTRIIIHDLASHRDLRSVGAPESLTLHAVYWANDDTVLVYESATQAMSAGGRDTYEMYRWIAIDAAGGDDRLLLMRGGDRQWVTGADLVRRRTSKPGKLFMSTLDFSETHYREEVGSRLRGGRKDSGWISNLYEVDLKSGDARVIEAGTPYTTDWLTDDSGNRVVRSEWNPRLDQFEIVAKDGGGWRSVYKSPGCGRLGLVAVSTDGKAVVTRGRTCQDSLDKLIALPLDGTAARTMAEDKEYEVDGVVRDPYDDSVLGVTLSRDDDDTRWLDPLAERRAAGLHKTFPASAVTVMGRSANSRRIVARVVGNAQPPVYYFIDYDAKSADIINEAYPKLAGVTFGKIQDFKYEARDKYSLLAYLTLPPGGSEQNLPLVVMPHGGPESRDFRGFDWLAQFLASRGYAVLQPQFRGSSGFGRAHADAGRHQWGLRMQDDVTDAVKAAIERGVADPKRVCIVGWSYGGYAALAGAAFTPDLYACAVSIAGVADLPAMLGYENKSSGKESNTVAYWKDHIGSATDPQVVAKSPARSAQTIRAPILLLHGTDDTVVPIAQSRLMARALDAAKKPYEFVELPGDDHSLNASVTRVKMATELERFLVKYLPVGPVTANAAH